MTPRERGRRVEALYCDMLSRRDLCIRIASLEEEVAEQKAAVDFAKRLEKEVNAGRCVDLWGNRYVPDNGERRIMVDLAPECRDKVFLSGESVFDGSSEIIGWVV